MQPATVTTIVLVVLALAALAMAAYAWFSPWQPVVRRAVAPDQHSEAEIEAAVRQMRREIEAYERRQRSL